jgi:subtilisin-like proprotein convertase family protein
MKRPSNLSRLLVIGGISITALVACPGADTTPDAFSFVNKTGLSITETGNIESDPITIQGMTAATNINVSGGSYGIDGATCQSGASTISVGQSLRLCAPHPKKFGEENTVTVDVGGTTASFKAIAENLESLTFAPASIDASGKADSAAKIPTWTSNLTELDVNFKSVTGVTGATGGFKIGAGTCQTTAAKLKKTDSIKACTSVPGGTVNGAKAIVTLEFGSATTGLVTRTFEASVGTGVADNIVLTPNNFTPTLGVPASSLQTSNELTVSGVAAGTSVPISITPAAATLFVNNIEKPDASSVQNGEKIKVRITSSAAPDTTSTVTVKVGAAGKEVTATYAVRTAGALGPDEFAPIENVVDYVPPPADYTTVTNTTTALGLPVADTSPTCKYGLGGSVGPWRKATAAEILAGTIDLTVRNEDRMKFMKTTLPKTEWNSCPENWDEAAIAAAGDAGLQVGTELRKFGKTVINFSVNGTGNVSKVELKLKLAHESRADLLMTLVSPNGTRVIVFDLARNWRDDDNLRNTQFSNPNYQNRLNESAGISVIFDDAATPPALDPGATWQPTDLNVMATVRYRCGPNDWRIPQTNGSLLVRKGNNLGACWDNANRDGKSNFPGLTGFGSFGRIKPSNPLSAFVGVAKAGTWKLEIEDRAPGNQENNDDAFPPNRPLAGATITDAAGKSVTGVTGDNKELVRQPTLNATNIPKLRIAVLTVK